MHAATLVLLAAVAAVTHAAAQEDPAQEAPAQRAPTATIRVINSKGKWEDTTVKANGGYFTPDRK
ncbi:hypothetical protein IMZ48_21280 [Candidatus Bathyarchaeota archaeon]|nr:hypothetical protein [Candidatus Bathyarchaeota archaeon]